MTKKPNKEEVPSFSGIEDVLTIFYNRHLEQYVSALIDIEVYTVMCAENEKQVIGERMMTNDRGQQIPVPVTAGKMLLERKEALKNQKRILDSIEVIRRNHVK